MPQQSNESSATQRQYNHPQVLRWNIGDDFYKDGMTLYADGLLEINVGGMVCGKSLKNWFEAAKAYDENQATIVNQTGEEIRSRDEIIKKLGEILTRIDNAANVYTYKSPEEGFDEVLVVFSAGIHQRCGEALALIEKKGE